MAGQGIKVGPLFAAGGGIILLWSAITGRKWSSVLKTIIQGKDPRTVNPTNQITSAPLSAGGYGYSAGLFPGNPPIGQISGKNNQGIAQSMLSAYGWSPGELLPLIALWTRESGWNPLARNPVSGAFGIAQALGHGCNGCASGSTNEYGAQYGLTVAEARRANAGDPVQQIRWGFGYIKSRYGSPSAALAHENSAGWY